MPQRIDVPGHGIVEFPDGMSDDQIVAAIQQNPAPTMADKAGGLYKALDAGVAKGVAGLGGFLGDASNLGAKGIEAATNFVTDKLGIERAQTGDRSKSVLNAIPTSESVGKAIQADMYDGAEPYKPQGKAEKYAQAIGEFAPGMIGGPAGMLRRGFTQVAAPAVMSETAGQLTEGSKAEPYARVLGAVLAPAAVSGAGRAVTPFRASPERQRLVDILHNEGVDSLTAGQRTGSKPLQYMEDTFGNAPGAGRGAERIQQEGQRQFTEAAMRRTGGGPTAGPDDLLMNHNRLSQEFRDLSARNNLVFDQQFGQDAMNAVQNYQRVPPSQQRAIVARYIDDIVQHMQNGQMPGRYYQEMRSRLSRQANGLRQSDPTLSEALRDLRNSLDNAMERSISPGDAQAWRTARQQYGAQKTVEKAASRAGEATAEGNVVPANLRNTVAAENRGQYARGQGQFSELARAGSGVMAPLPNSGTGQRVNAWNMLNQLTLGAVPAVAGRTLMSRPVQSYLANQLLGQVPAGANRRAALMNALMAGDRQLLQQPQ
jgi:hypothetical protein